MNSVSLINCILQHFPLASRFPREVWGESLLCSREKSSRCWGRSWDDCWSLLEGGTCYSAGPRAAFSRFLEHPGSGGFHHQDAWSDLRFLPRGLSSLLRLLLGVGQCLHWAHLHCVVPIPRDCAGHDWFRDESGRFTRRLAWGSSLRCPSCFASRGPIRWLAFNQLSWVPSRDVRSHFR